MKGDQQVEPPTYALSLVLDDALLPSDASIKDFQRGKVGYVANSMEQALLLPKDMADFRSMRKHKVFLDLKRDLAMVSPSTPSLIFTYYIFIFYYFFLFLC